MQTAELAALPLSERLRAMEVLWGSLCQEPEQVQTVPDWQEAKDHIRQRTRCS